MKKNYKPVKPWLVAPLTILAIGGAGMLDTTEAKAEQVNPDVASKVQEQTTPQASVNNKIDTGNKKLDEAVGEAQQVGVSVEQTQAQEEKTVEAVNKNYSEQESVVKDTTQAQKEINKTTDEVVKNAEDSGVKVTEGQEKVFEDIDKGKSEAKKQVEELNNKSEVQKELDKQRQEAVKNAEDNGVKVTEKEKQTYTDTEKAREDVKKQVTALEDATKVMNEANKLIDEAISQAVKNGTPIKDGGMINVSVEEAMAKAKEIADSIQAVDSENAEIKARNAQALAAYNKAKSELDAKNTKIKAENEAIAKRNKAKQDKYNKELNNFNKGVNREITITALTQNTDPNVQAPSKMNSTVNQKTGEFTLNHDMNDSYNIIGHGVLKGKLHTSVKSLGNGKEEITINSVELYSYTYTNTGKKNQLANKNINFHVYVNGKEIYVRVHNGDNTFSDKINKTFGINKKFVVNAGQTTPGFEFMRIDDNWVWNTHGQVWTKLKNTNKAPVKPKLEQEKPVDPTKLTPPTPEELKEATQFKIVVESETHPVQLEAEVNPIKLKAEVHPVNLKETPKPVKAEPNAPLSNTPVKPASVLPVTGEKEEMLGVLGIAMLTSLGLVAVNKKRKVN